MAMKNPSLCRSYHNRGIQQPVLSTNTERNTPNVSIQTIQPVRTRVHWRHPLSKLHEPVRPKKTWSTPTLIVLSIRSAQGSTAGPLCDKHGSLSYGSGCP